MTGDGDDGGVPAAFKAHAADRCAVVVVGGCGERRGRTVGENEAAVSRRNVRWPRRRVHVVIVVVVETRSETGQPVSGRTTRILHGTRVLYGPVRSACSRSNRTDRCRRRRPEEPPTRIRRSCAPPPDDGRRGWGENAHRTSFRCGIPIIRQECAAAAAGHLCMEQGWSVRWCALCLRRSLADRLTYARLTTLTHASLFFSQANIFAQMERIY